MIHSKHHVNLKHQHLKYDIALMSPILWRQNSNIKTSTPLILSPACVALQSTDTSTVLGCGTVSITGYHHHTAVSIQYCFIPTTSTAFIIRYSITVQDAGWNIHLLYWFCRMSDSKPSTQLLSEIEKADSKTLKDVTTIENPAAKHDMAMVSRKLFSVENYSTFSIVWSG